MDNLWNNILSLFADNLISSKSLKSGFKSSLEKIFFVFLR